MPYDRYGRPVDEMVDSLRAVLSDKFKDKYKAAQEKYDAIRLEHTTIYNSFDKPLKELKNQCENARKEYEKLLAKRSAKCSKLEKIMPNPNHEINQEYEIIFNKVMLEIHKAKLNKSVVDVVELITRLSKGE